MAELRSVDPQTLIPNPNNPRRTATPPAMDQQLLASIQAVGVIQPPRVVETADGLMVVAGNRRRTAAIAAGLAAIDVMVCDADEAADAMRAVSENLVRASMNGVDIWRATEALERQGWNEQAIADALALPPRTVRKLKLLACLHPPMLDAMAAGAMPNEEQLRTIAAASREEQAQVWKKHKPKKGQAFHWHPVASALGKRRMPFAAARFDDDLAHAYGVVWLDDLFAPAGEDGRYTTDVEGFFGAQQEWMQTHLPPRGTLLPTDEYGRPSLPRKAQAVYGKPAKGDQVGCYLDHRTGTVETVAYRMPEARMPTKAGQGRAVDLPADEPPRSTRPEVTQKGKAIIGDLRTDALHQALREAPIDDNRLVALLVLALAGRNVEVRNGSDGRSWDRQAIADTLAEGGVLSGDTAAIRDAARRMLVAVLSCRDNMSDSGLVSRIAGAAIDASACLPNMATDAFLSCLSKAGVEKAALAEGVRVEVRAKDTRARLIERFKTGTYVYPNARFQLTADDLASANASRMRHDVPGSGWAGNADGDAGNAEADATGDEHGSGVDDDEAAADAADEYAVAAE